MKSEWTKVELGGLIDTQKGFAFKSSWYTSFGVPIVRVSDFTDNSISINEINYISNDLAEEHIKHQLQFRDILIQTVGSWQSNPASIVGKVVTVPIDLNGALLNQNAVKIVPKSEIDKRFLYYRLKEENFKLHNLNHAQGAANQASITLESIKKFNFKLPPLPTQRKIASILSSYDDLIENNLKRIQLLEEKAQLTYEEWFVKMRFPGYETAKFDAFTGLPEGWEIKNIGAICKVSGGGTPSRAIDEYWNDGDIIWYSPTDLSKANSLCVLDSSQKITEIGLKKSSAKLLDTNSFMMTSRATIGLFALINKPFSTNQGFINVTPLNEFEKEYLLYNFKYRIEEFKGHATGATFPELSKSKFNALDIIWPSAESLKQFNKITSILHIQLFNLTEQNRLLKEARDILLPRLMSGMIDVDKITGQVVEEMETFKNK